MLRQEHVGKGAMVTYFCRLKCYPHTKRRCNLWQNSSVKFSDEWMFFPANSNSICVKPCVWLTSVVKLFCIWSQTVSLRSSQPYEQREVSQGRLSFQSIRSLALKELSIQEQLLFVQNNFVQGFMQFNVAELCLMMLFLKKFGHTYFLKIKTCHEIKAVFTKCTFKMKMKNCWRNNVETYQLGAWLKEKPLSWHTFL